MGAWSVLRNVPRRRKRLAAAHQLAPSPVNVRGQTQTSLYGKLGSPPDMDRLGGGLMGCDVIEWGWDGKGWDGTGREGLGWDGMGRMGEKKM